MSEWPMTAAETFALALTIAGLLCGGAYWVSAVNHDRSTFKRSLDSFMKEIRDDIKGILSRLPADPTAESASPLRLSDLGKSVAKELDAYEWAVDLAPSLVKKVQGKEPYEIDNFCEKHVYSDLTEHWEMMVLATAYARGLSEGAVRTVLRITLRDELLRLTGQ